MIRLACCVPHCREMIRVKQIQEGEAPWPDLMCFVAQSADGSPVHPMARGRHRVSDGVQAMVLRKGEGR